MSSTDHDLSPMQEDTLRELGNMGAGHAATALAQLIGRRVDIGIPEAGTMDVSRVAELIGGGDQVVAAVTARLLGESRGGMAVLLKRADAMALGDLLQGRPAGSSRSFTEAGISALLEAGNILMGTYLTAVSNLLGIVLMPSVPAFRFDLASAVLEQLIEELKDPDAGAVVTHTHLQEQDALVEGHVLFVPQVDTLKAMLDALSKLTGGDDHAR